MQLESSPERGHPRSTLRRLWRRMAITHSVGLPCEGQAISRRSDYRVRRDVRQNAARLSLLFVVSVIYGSTPATRLHPAVPASLAEVI